MLSTVGSPPLPLRLASSPTVLGLSLTCNLYNKKGGKARPWRGDQLRRSQGGLFHHSELERHSRKFPGYDPTCSDADSPKLVGFSAVVCHLDK